MRKLLSARNWIGGEWTDAPTRLNSINPATGEVIGTYADGSADEANRAIAIARKAFLETPWRGNRRLHARAIKRDGGSLRSADRGADRHALSRERQSECRGALRNRLAPKKLRLAAALTLVETGRAILTNKRSQRPAGRRHHIALGDCGCANLSVNKGANFGVAEIDFCRLQLRFCSGNLRRQGALGGERRIEIRLRSGRPRKQIPGALQRLLGIEVLSLQLVHRRLAGIDQGLKGGLLQLVKQIALVDLSPLDKQPLFEKASDPGDQYNPADRLDPADELIALGNLLALRADHADGRGTARSGLCRYAPENR
jgi:Aldehyde dehydrogenase family